MFSPGLMDQCTGCKRHMLCVMGRDMHFCVLCHHTIDLELICMQGRDHDCHNDSPSTYCQAKRKRIDSRLCPYVVPHYPDLCSVVDSKVLLWVGRERVMLLPRFNGVFWAYMHLSFGYLGYCGDCRKVWKEIVNTG